jgi:hypothetical protein
LIAEVRGAAHFVIIFATIAEAGKLLLRLVQQSSAEQINGIEMPF